MKKLLFLMTIITLSLYATESSAQIFRIRATDYGAGNGNAVFENFVNAELLKIETKINKDLPSGEPTRLMEGIANSSVMAGKGIGSDYASYMSVFLIGGGVGAGADLAKDKESKSDLSGVGVAPGVIIGANLGFLKRPTILGLETKRINLYLNFMSYGHEQTISDKKDEESSAKLDMQSLGAHLRYDWIDGSGSKWLGWGGVKLHLGYECNKTDITFSSKINETVNESTGNGEVLNGTVTGSPSATILVNTCSIPVEVSTDVRFLYFLSLYGGVGADYNMGTAKGGGALNSSPSTINCTGGVCGGGGGTDVTVEANANIDAEGRVNPFLFRGFAGIQFNLPYVRIFGQVDKGLGNDLIGATAGVRFVY